MDALITETIALSAAHLYNDDSLPAAIGIPKGPTIFGGNPLSPFMASLSNHGGTFLRQTIRQDQYKRSGHPRRLAVDLSHYIIALLPAR